jgi:transposase
VPGPGGPGRRSDQAKNRLFAFLLRHGRVWRDGDMWTLKHRRWLATQRFDDLALATTFACYRAAVETREAAIDAVEADRQLWFERDPFGWQVARLGAYRGFTHLGALAMAAEVADWRRFASARHFMGFVGLTPSEYSSGDTTRRGRITKAGNAHLRPTGRGCLVLPSSPPRRRHDPPPSTRSPT